MDGFESSLVSDGMFRHNPPAQGGDAESDNTVIRVQQYG